MPINELYITLPGRKKGSGGRGAYTCHRGIHILGERERKKKFIFDRVE